MPLARWRACSQTTESVTRRRGVLVAATAALAAIAGGQGVAEAAAPVPCSPSGGGRHNCSFYIAGDGKSGGSPVQAASRTVGYLHEGTNWVVCQQVGGRVTRGEYFNNNWAWTLADNNQWGWVNAVYASGGDNDGPFRGVPGCNGAHGAPPGGAGAPAPKPPPPRPPSGKKFPPDMLACRGPRALRRRRTVERRRELLQRLQRRRQATAGLDPLPVRRAGHRRLQLPPEHGRHVQDEHPRRRSRQRLVP